MFDSTLTKHELHLNEVFLLTHESKRALLSCAFGVKEDN